MTYHTELRESVFRDRLKRVQKLMSKNSLDCLIVAGQPQFFPSYSGDIRYIANWAQYSGNNLMLITSDGDPTILVNLDAVRKQFRRCTWISDIRVARSGSLGATISGILRERDASGSIGSVGLENLPAKIYLEIMKAFPGRDMRDAKHIFEQLRLIKSSEEIALLARSARASDAMLEELLFASVKPDAWVYKARANALSAAYREGAEWASLWISSGGVAPIDGRGYTPYDGAWRRFRKGDQINVGTYLIRQGYWGHSQRSAVIGEPTVEQQRIFDIVYEAYRAALSKIGPGRRAIEVDEAARQVLDREGLYHPMRNGHSIGLDYQEQPLSAAFPDEQLQGRPNTRIILREGMVFELHVTGQFGEDGLAACVGDMCAVTASGVERLTKFPRDLKIRGRGHMTPGLRA